MMRWLYVWLLRRHPRRFRERFGDEMLWIYDESPRGGRGRLLGDGVLSLIRQRLLRRPLPEVQAAPAAGPRFVSADLPVPAFAVLARGSVVSFALFALVYFGLAQGGAARAPRMGAWADARSPGRQQAPRVGVEQPSLRPATILRRPKTVAEPSVADRLRWLLLPARWQHPPAALATSRQALPGPTADRSEQVTPLRPATFLEKLRWLLGLGPWRESPQPVVMVPRVEMPPAPLITAGGEALVPALLRVLDEASLLGLGEWHGTRQDSDLRLRLIGHPQFARKARLLVMECANARHQDLLDRYIRGERVDPAAVLDDVTAPGACNSPVYRELLDVVREVNRKQPLRILAADPPIDWSRITSYGQWRGIAATRDTFAASLITTEVLLQGEKALLLFGAGHLWRNTAGVVIPDDETLAARLDARHPGALYTVLRTGGAIAELEKVSGKAKPPVLLPLRQPGLATLDANRILGRDVPVRLFREGTGVGSVADALVYSGREPDTVVPGPPLTVEQRRRLALTTAPRAPRPTAP